MVVENKSQTAKKKPRGAGWKKGQSGNPGGRPKAAIDVRDLARQHTVAAVTTLATIMQDPAAKEAPRVAAACALLDRGWGKAPISIDAGDGKEAARLIIIGLDA